MATSNTSESIYIREAQVPDSSQEVTSVVISSVFSSYTTTLPAVQTLYCSDDDLLYFSCLLGQPKEKNQFVKGTLLKKSIKILQTLQKDIFDLTINKDGEILFNESYVNKLHILSPTGENRPVLDTAPMIPLGIHVNKDNEVIVGMREQGPPFPVQMFSVRQVLFFGNDYQRKVTLEFDKEGNKLFNYAARIRTDSQNVVYVIDTFDSEGSGRIVAVDRNGHLKFTYDGQKNLRTFRPEGITITPSDNVVVADYNNGALHVMNPRGELLGLQFIFIRFGINYPLSLCFDTEGYLLIGCWKGKSGDYGKIHFVKMADNFM